MSALGTHDFDFLFGTWDVINRQLVTGTQQWREFHTTCHARPILGGAGNVDEFHFAGADDQGPWDASTVRVYDAPNNLWRIYWASTAYPGPLGDPMCGRFSDGVGVFLGEESVDGDVAEVRFLWTHEGVHRARWEQAIRRPGHRWEPNWIMEFRPHSPSSP